jgi:hypothetical protein
MESTTLMPMAVAGTPIRRRAVASYVRMPMTLGAMPSASAFAHLGCDWSHTTIATEDRQANAKALKANGTRRLGETST